MIRALGIVGALVMPVGWLGSDGGAYTLYRSSVLDPGMRLHVATFDAADGEQYNGENCSLAADLLQHQDGVKVRFWCEKGHYRK
jgi:hypothetical protein